MARHPRRARLGLIEGFFVVFFLPPHLDDCIRGARASASLKAVLGTPIRLPCSQKHPRRARLGLIEGQSWTARVMRTSMHPRRARLGLIEGPSTPAGITCRISHPRRARLGLIEGMKLRRAAYDRIRASEARAPRPH